MLCSARKGGSCLRASWRGIPRSSHRLYGIQPRLFGRRFSQASNVEKSFVEDLGNPPILKPFLFAVSISGGALFVAAYATNRDTEKWMRSLMKTGAWGILSGPPTSEDLRRARYLDLVSTLKTWLDKAKAWLGDSPNYVSKVAVYTYAMGAQNWLNSAEGRRVCRTIILLNSVVWLAWQIPRLRPVMNRHFLHSPLSGLSHTLLTSVFSHKNLLHLLCNGLALSGFGSTTLLYLTMEQDRSPHKLQESTTRYHFVSFFISAGLFSSLISHMARARFYYPRMLTQLSSTTGAATAASNGAAATATGARAAAAVPTILPSLGSSGAIWACVSLTAMAFPDAQMALFIPTSFAIPIQAGTIGLVGLDVIGIIRGWRFFDHWAHLGGAMFGALYYVYGPHVWEQARLYTRPP